MSTSNDKLDPMISATPSTAEKHPFDVEVCYCGQEVAKHDQSHDIRVMPRHSGQAVAPSAAEKQIAEEVVRQWNLLVFDKVKCGLHPDDKAQLHDIVLSVLTKSRPSGQAVDAEWTVKLDHNEPDYGWIVVCRTQKISHRMKVFDLNGIIQAHNATLKGQAVDRQEEAAYEKLQIKCQGCGVSWFIEIPRRTETERNRSWQVEKDLAIARPLAGKLFDENHDLRQQLLSALAAIEKCQDALQWLRDYQNGCPLPSYEKNWNHAMKLTDEALALKLDLSLLHQHDAHVAHCANIEGYKDGYRDGKEVRKPLVEALEEIRDHIGDDWGWLRSKCEDALEKVKEKS